MAISNRRQFLGHLSRGFTSAAIGSAFGHLSGRIATAENLARPLYGPLRETLDESTGLPLLKLPAGFRYWSYGWTDQPMSNQQRTPSNHDGMAIIAEQGNRIILCRNHELAEPGAAFWDHAYDPFGGAGCTNLVFDRAAEQFVESRPSLAGTVNNCAGGATPWNTWLSCEETVVGPETKFANLASNPLTQPHGFVFEVPSEGQTQPEPLRSLGRFVHEAVAVCPDTHIVYLTEDTQAAGFYRMIPVAAGDLKSFGQFQMMMVKQRDDLRQGVQVGQRFDVSWVEIPDRLRAHSPGTQDGQGVYQQGQAVGGATFARLEGVALHDGKVFITATSGGEARAGQVWEYDPATESLHLLFESPDMDVLHMPDNMCVSCRGEIFLCEDGKFVPQRLQVLTPQGLLSPFAENNIHLTGLHGHRGDFRGSEWAGATFSRDGQWLFVNIQNPGVTFAITGPWPNLPTD
jgi:secreted PhoX family phosphatase